MDDYDRSIMFFVLVYVNVQFTKEVGIFDNLFICYLFSICLGQSVYATQLKLFLSFYCKSLAALLCG